MPAAPGPAAVQDYLVRLGRLTFDDFCRLEPADVAAALAASPDWPVALTNAPHVRRHFARCCPDAPALAREVAAGRDLSIDAVRIIQTRLVAAHAPELLREKAPPLHDALPWHDWDFAIVSRRVPVWQTRFLFAGCGSTVAFCRCRRTAGGYVVEPSPTLCRYLTRKAELERLRRVTVLQARPEAIPLPARAADLVVAGGAMSAAALAELGRVAGRVLVVDCDPLAPIDAISMEGLGFRAEPVEVRGLGRRLAWWRG